MASVIAVSQAGPTVGLGYIISQLGQSEHGDRWRVRYVALLIESQGFPAPFPFMRGEQLIQGVTRESRWHRLAVDQWLLDRLPPDAAAAQDDRARLAAANDMDAGAIALAAQLSANRARRIGGAR